MTYNDARKQAILQLLDDGISAQAIAAATDGDESNLNDLIDALTDRILERASKKETRAA